MGKLSEKALEARRDYERRWRAKNPDKVRAKNRRYWEKQARIREEAAENEQTQTV